MRGSYLTRRTQTNIQKIIFAFGVLLIGVGLVYGQSAINTKFTNQGSIANTRHNMTQAPPAGGVNSGLMDFARNNYGEVCVYCHAPHGADSTVMLPLWNRTTKATTYKTYNELNTSSLRQEVTQPGANSLSCLSCHDGQTAVDSIINMPGSGRYQASQASITDVTFLNTWPGNPDVVHQALNPAGCLSCHGAVAIAGAPDFKVANIGTNLTNVHPVGVTFPWTNGPGTDYKSPTGAQGSSLYFDKNSNGIMDSGDVRLYYTGATPKVECASCHDPHGVPSAGPGSTFNPTFLRVNNIGNVLCLTCHTK